MQEYAQRLSNVLDAEHQILFDADPVIAQLSSPPSKSRQLNLQSDQKIKLRDFYNLPNCGIKPLIAERNTTMGKLQTPSQRYLYELRLTNVLNKCLAMAEPEDKDKLQAILILKQQDMQNAWRAFILTSKELQLATANKAVHFSQTENHDFAVLSWQQLAQYAPDTTKYVGEKELGELESHLKTISDYKTPAKLFNDSFLLSVWLPQITDFLESQTNEFNCVSRKEKQKVEYLKNVFHLFFVEKIQPLTSNMNKWYYKLEPVLESLHHPLIQINSTDSFPEQKKHYDDSLKQHVQFWQKLFKRCGVNPARK